jgi:acyl-CoA oxidase
VSADGIETCRRACGGHGYLLSSGLPSLLGTYLQSVTVEGDNYLLPQQTTRFLLRAFTDVAHGITSVPESCAYLLRFERNSIAKCSAATAVDFSPSCAGVLDLLVEAFEFRAWRLLKDLVVLLQELTLERKMSSHDAWVLSLVEVGRVSHAHCHAFLLRTFARFVSTTPPPSSSSSQLTDPTCFIALRRLCVVFGLSGIEDAMGDWLEGNYFSPSQARWVRSALRSSLAGELADDCVGLCDAWDFADRQLQSTLGRKDGNVYAAILEMAHRSTLNTELSASECGHLLRPLEHMSKHSNAARL